jgi:hypothetical protein
VIRQAFSVLVFIALALASLGAWANATTLSVSGDVQITPKGGSSARLAEGQRVSSGAALKTGPNSGVTIRFDDGQMLALTSNSSLVIDEYRFNPHKPEEGGIFTSLFRGGIRMVTGLIGKATPESVKTTTPVATIGIRGTDFQLFFEGRLFISVGDGAIGVANPSGETVFDAAKQPLGIVPDAQTKARAATLAEFSADAVAAMRRLDIEPNFGTRKPDPNDPSCSDRR